MLDDLFFLGCLGSRVATPSKTKMEPENDGF